MRRDTFLKSMMALAAAGALPLSAQAATAMKMMLPANPGGGWDTTGRAVGKALIDAGVASTVTYDNKGGAAGAIGLAQFVNGSKGDANALMVMGAVMLGGIITGKPPVNLSQATPLARLTSEYNVFVLPANSPFKSMAEVVAQLKKDPGSIKWGGGSRGSTEHIAAAMIARAVGVDPAKINYVAFRGGSSRMWLRALSSGVVIPHLLDMKTIGSIPREVSSSHSWLNRIGFTMNLCVRKVGVPRRVPDPKCEKTWRLSPRTTVCPA